MPYGCGDFGAGNISFTDRLMTGLRIFRQSLHSPFAAKAEV